MAKGTIVIVTSTGDFHTDDVAVKLQEMGQRPIVLNTDHIPLDTTMSFRFDSGASAWTGGIALHKTRDAIDVAAIRSIWWRRPGAYFGLPPELSEQEREFAKGELDHLLGGLWSMLDCYWVSHPDRIRQANWKLEQLRRAVRSGFEVPPTLVTSDPDEVRAFYDAFQGQIVFKVMTDPLLGAIRVREKWPDQPPPEPRSTKTTPITAAELEQMDSVRLVPCLFQAYVPKRVELRVTVIGDDLFAAEIDSQALETTRVDWRGSGTLEIPHRATTLPDEVAQRCMALVRSYGLNFSALDLIITPDDRYVFLENNPNGQFIWIEKLVPELEMTAALASCLARGANG